MKSNRILYGHTVERHDEGLTINLDGDYGELVLSVDDLRKLLAFAERGEEPPPTDTGRKDFAEFLDRLLRDEGK